jgi:hypothetical protein
MDAATLWTAGIAAAVFGLAYLRALYLGYAVDKRSKLKDADMTALLRTKYTALDATVEGGTKPESDRYYETAHRHHHGHHKKLMDEKGHLYKKMREFHRSSIAYVTAFVCGLLTLYYLALATNVLNVERTADAVLVNPWRWFVVLSACVGTTHMFVGLASQFRIFSLVAFAVHGGMGRVIAGIALLTLPGSIIFWVLSATALGISIVSLMFMYWRYDRAVAGHGMASTVTIWYALAALIIHGALFLGSYEVFAWLNYDMTIILSAVADGLLFLLPSLYILSDAYYYRGSSGGSAWPLFPRFIYDEYGMGHYWKAEAKPQLVYLIEAAKRGTRAETTPVTGSANTGDGKEESEVSAV